MLCLIIIYSHLNKTNKNFKYKKQQILKDLAHKNNHLV